MRAIRLAVAVAFLFAALPLAPVRATAFSADQSDLWWNAAESGWGIQFVQRAGLIFATMFVYGTNGTPTWYTALLTPSGALAWSGDLVATSGSYFGLPFNAASTVATKVGTMTWTATDTTTGTLTYTVNGVAVAKHLVRQFITYDDFSGTFVGGIHQTQAQCTDASKNGTFEDYATAAVTQNGQSFGFTLASQMGLNCTYAGTLVQAGRFGSTSGTITCAGKPSSVSFSGLAVGIDSLSLHYDAIDSTNGCHTSGYFAGARHR
jgi:hypothetical protein